VRVLITGSAGTIGRDLRSGLRGRHELLRLLDVAEQEPAGAGEEIVSADVADAAAIAPPPRGWTRSSTSLPTRSTRPST
jgi:uronate dehydrogenase